MAIVNLNERALRVAVELASRADELGCRVHSVGGARVIDAGAKVTGSLAAGVLVARACLADLADITLAPGTPGVIGGVPTPMVHVTVSHPVAACMASQYAGWAIQVGRYFAMGSGPMRAAYGKEELFDDIGRHERPGLAVGVLESSNLPDEAVIRYIAEKANVAPDRITLIVARTASLAGGVQVVARSVETAMHKLHELKFDLRRIVSGTGWAPLPPVAKDDMSAIGRTNDAVLYGACVVLHVRGDDESLEAVGRQLPSSASRDYGEPFAAIFKRYDHDFYKIDKMLFSPACVSLQNIDTGRTFTFGKLNHEVLSRSFFG